MTALLTSRSDTELACALDGWIGIRSHIDDAISLHGLILGSEEIIKLHPLATVSDAYSAIGARIKDRMNAVGPEFAMAHALSTRHNYASDHMNQDPWS